MSAAGTQRKCGYVRNHGESWRVSGPYLDLEIWRDDPAGPRPTDKNLQASGLTEQRAGNYGAEGLRASEDNRAWAAGPDDLTSRRQHSVRLVDRERHDRVGVLLIAVALVGVGRIEDFGCRIEAKKAGGLRVCRRPAHRR